jgi:hypothetical protein
MKMVLGDFNIKIGRENISKPTIGNISLHEINIHNEFRAVNFATSIDPTVKCTMFIHRNCYKYARTSPD